MFQNNVRNTYFIFYIQVNLAMSNLLISITRYMSKWSSIPEHFLYVALYFKHVYVELGYHEISAISKWFFIPKISFPLLYHYLCRSKFCFWSKN